MKTILFSCLFCLIFVVTKAQFVSLNNNEIKKLKLQIKNDEEVKKQYASFEKLALKYLNEDPFPIDTIRSEGLLKGHPKKERTFQSLPDFNKMFTLALHYKITGDKKFLKKSTEFLTAWAKVNHSKGDPIDDTKLDQAFEAYDLIKNDISTADRKLIDDWLRNTANAEVHSKYMLPGRATATNNWNAHRLKVVGIIGYLINDKTLINWSIENLKKHIQINLYPDGTSLDFKQRDAMHYHIYDLEPMLKLIMTVKRSSNENLYSYESSTGASIKKSVDWFLPYMSGEKQHEEYVNTTVKFDRDRAKNNEVGFAPGTMFKPDMAQPVFRLAAYFDPLLIPVLNKINPAEKTWETILDQLVISK